MINTNETDWLHRSARRNKKIGEYLRLAPATFFQWPSQRLSNMTRDSNSFSPALGGGGAKVNYRGKKEGESNWKAVVGRKMANIRRLISCRLCHALLFFHESPPWLSGCPGHDPNRRNGTSEWQKRTGMVGGKWHR